MVQFADHKIGPSFLNQVVQFADHKIGPSFLTLKLKFRGKTVGKLALKESEEKISLMSYDMEKIREHLSETKKEYGEEDGWILLNELIHPSDDVGTQSKKFGKQKYFGGEIQAARFVTAFDGQNDWVFRRYLGDDLQTNQMGHVLFTVEPSYTEAMKRAAEDGGWDHCGPMTLRFMEVRNRFFLSPGLCSVRVWMLSLVHVRHPHPLR